VQGELAMLLNLNPIAKIYPQRITEFNYKAIDYKALVDSAKVNRPDFLMANKNIDFYNASLKKQRAEAIPNINLGYQPLDQGSNHVRPYAGMVFEMVIPIFNRNQGNISAAKVQIEQSKIMLDHKARQIEIEVMTGFLQLQNSKSLYDSYNQDLLGKMADMYSNSTLNYEKKNISLIEYIDYQRAYVDNQKNYIDVKNTLIQNLNQLSFIVGKNINN
jgi:outer membrane protein, heavy metal efflux system